MLKAGPRLGADGVRTGALGSGLAQHASVLAGGSLRGCDGPRAHPAGPCVRSLHLPLRVSAMLMSFESVTECVCERERGRVLRALSETSSHHHHHIIITSSSSSSLSCAHVRTPCRSYRAASRHCIAAAAAVVSRPLRLHPSSPASHLTPASDGSTPRALLQLVSRHLPAPNPTRPSAGRWRLQHRRRDGARRSVPASEQRQGQDEAADAESRGEDDLRAHVRRVGNPVRQGRDVHRDPRQARRVQPARDAVSGELGHGRGRDGGGADEPRQGRAHERAKASHGGVQRGRAA
eukprot:1403344-Rhodomonas_salina.1